MTLPFTESGIVPPKYPTCCKTLNCCVSLRPSPAALSFAIAAAYSGHSVKYSMSLSGTASTALSACFFENSRNAATCSSFVRRVNPSDDLDRSNICFATGNCVLYVESMDRTMVSAHLTNAGSCDMMNESRVCSFGRPSESFTMMLRNAGYPA